MQDMCEIMAVNREKWPAATSRPAVKRATPVEFPFAGCHFFSSGSG
jgi:hypothetical protein